MKLNSWNKGKFGNIFKRKKQNLLWLEGVHRSLERHVIEALLKLEMKLREERKELLLQEKMLWLQKSLNDWLKFADGNTKFLHTSTLVRRRRNKTEPLLNDQGA